MLQKLIFFLSSPSIKVILIEKKFWGRVKVEINVKKRKKKLGNYYRKGFELDIGKGVGF